tara:strand:+ start:751 stop:918 length:168 start_codon:yes stop_codon:yes gene_type:complete
MIRGITVEFEAKPIVMKSWEEYKKNPCPLLPSPEAMMDLFKRDMDELVMKGVLDD